MAYEDDIIKKVFGNLKDKHRICKNCKFNFDIEEDKNICAAHDSHWGYGEKIEYDFESCYAWEISFELFDKLAKKEG